MLSVAEKLLKRNIPVFFEGSRAGKFVCEEFLEEHPNCFSLHGILNTDELAAMIQRARIFIGYDSGPAHVAQAVGTPAVILFGELEPHRWGPLPSMEGEKLPKWEVVSGCPGNWLVEERLGLPLNESMRLLPEKAVFEAISRVLGLPERAE